MHVCLSDTALNTTHLSSEAAQHLPRPLMKLMTLALLQHTDILSIVGKEEMVSRIVPNKDKCSLVQSVNVLVLHFSRLCPPRHSFHGAQSRVSQKQEWRFQRQTAQRVDLDRSVTAAPCYGFL